MRKEKRIPKLHVSQERGISGLRLKHYCTCSEQQQQQQQQQWQRHLLLCVFYKREKTTINGVQKSRPQNVPVYFSQSTGMIFVSLMGHKANNAFVSVLLSFVIK